MSKRLVSLLALVVILAIGFLAMTRDQGTEQNGVEDIGLARTEATAVFIEETFAEPIETETAAEEDFVDAAISPKVQISEYPGRRVVVSGNVSTADDRRAIAKALESDLAESFKVDDQMKLDYQCGDFDWLSKVPDVDFSLIKDVRRFDITLTNTRVTMAGEVFNDTEARRISRQIQSALPKGVTLEDQIKVSDRPEPSLSVWAAPDRTFLISGTVPEGEAAGYVELVRSAMPGMPVVNDLSEDRFVDPPEWKEQIVDFLPGFLRTTQRAGIKISKGRVVKIEGLAQAKVMADLRRRLSASFPSPRYQMELDLQLGVPTEIKLAAPTVVGATAPKQQEARTVAEMIATVKIYFKSGRSRANQLDPTEIAKLDRLGRQWRQENFNQKVYVFGFTDSSGDPETNAYFSKTRCQNVAAYLRKTYGIDRSYFEIVGTPENHPAETGSASELRRVEFSLTDQPSQPPVANWSTDIKSATNVLKPINYQELLAKNKVIYLGSGQITPSRADRQSLSQLGNAMVLEKITDVVIVYGYSDGKGKAAANKWYTEERCKAVAKELTSAGVPRDQIVIRPVLAAQPTVKKDAEPKKKESKDEKKDGEEAKPEDNPRRVELVVMSREAFDAAEAEAKAARERASAVNEAALENEASEEQAPTTNEATTDADDPIIEPNGILDEPVIVPAGSLEDKVIVPAGSLEDRVIVPAGTPQE